MNYPPELLNRLRTLDAALAREILGQDHALPRIAETLKIGELGLLPGRRPRSSLLLLGPTGVGKTETAVVATRHLYGEDRLFRFDMSEYQTQDSIGLLLGARLGEKGFFALAREKADAGSILLDEIEKAHPRVLDLLLQLLDAARITVATGETLEFSRFHIWLTSNLGAAELLGIQHSSPATMERLVLGKAMRHLRPELFARIQEPVVFRPLPFEVQQCIVRKIEEDTCRFLANKGFAMSPATQGDLLRANGTRNQRLGVRLLRRELERRLARVSQFGE